MFSPTTPSTAPLSDTLVSWYLLFPSTCQTSLSLSETHGLGNLDLVKLTKAEEPEKNISPK